MDVEKKAEEIGAKFVQCSRRSLKIPIWGTAMSETSEVIAGRLSKLEPHGAAVVHESRGIHMKQIAFSASAVIWVIFTYTGFWSAVIMSQNVCNVR
jgi:hypothetical protein